MPTANHLDTIPGIGDVTAAVLTAFILDIDRFATPGKLVAYFGVLPIEMSSGVDRDGQPRGSRRYVMSKRGNDLVRRYLWMAALSAVRCNPAVRALYRRVVAKQPEQQGHRHRPRHAQAAAPGLRAMEERQTLRSRALPWDEAGRHAAASTDNAMSIDGGDGHALSVKTRLRATSRKRSRLRKWSPQPVLPLYHSPRPLARAMPSTSPT